MRSDPAPRPRPPRRVARGVLRPLGGDRLARARGRARRRARALPARRRPPTSCGWPGSSSRSRLGAAAAGVLVERLAGRPGPGWEPLVALNLRAVLLAFLALAVLARVDVLAAVAPWPWATRLLVVALAQIHALRLLATESLLGLRSRMPRRARSAAT